MKTWKNLTLIAAMLAATLPPLAVNGQSQQQTPNSAKSSSSSATRASDATAACMATAVELEKTRAFAASLETENRVLTERLATEKAATALLTELNQSRRAESEALKNTVAAKNETIAAKDSVIASQDKLVEALKKKKPS